MLSNEHLKLHKSGLLALMYLNIPIQLGFTLIMIKVN